MSELFGFFATQYLEVLEQLARHTALTFISVAIAVAVGIPLGILIARRERLSSFVLNIVGVLQTVPSIALLGFMIPLFGIGVVPAIIALMLYALLPLVRNTYTGIQAVDPNVVEAARALGMTENQILRKVQLPLAMPVIVAGIRTAMVINVGVATLAAYIGAGGLGEFIFGGIALNNTTMILAGAIPSALLAVALDLALSFVQRAASRRRSARMKRIWKYVFIGSTLVEIVIGIGVVIYLVFSSPPIAMRAGFTQEFIGRQDGYVGLKQVYGLDLSVVAISDAVMYKALAEKELDVISGYTTDGRIASYNLVALADDKHLFPPYHAAPLVRGQTLDRHPELRAVLNSLAGALNDSTMIALNYQVDFLKRAPQVVAREFLLRKALLTKGLRSAQDGGNAKDGAKRNASDADAATIVIGSKVFTEQYTLAEMYRILIEDRTELSVDLKPGLGGTQICFGALTNGSIDMYVEYTGTGLLVMLHTEGGRLDSLLKRPETVLDYVRSEFRQRYDLEWLEPLGFNNAYALMMRRDHAKQLGIRTISDLANKSQH